jgi:hypothetical protein
VDRTEGQAQTAVPRPPMPARLWIAASVIGVAAAAALLLPTYPPEPWASVIAWAVVIGAGLLGAVVGYVLGARLRMIAVTGAHAFVAAWLVALFVIVVDRLI